MIYVKRPAKAPELLPYTLKRNRTLQGKTKKMTSHAFETAQACLHFGTAGNYVDNKKVVAEAPPKFSVYGHAQIRGELKRIFHEKCGYCENEISASRKNLDIEHFRPKSAIKTGVLKTVELKSGYYWLASDWLNLLYACPSCNQGYKSTHFPLADEKLRIRHDSQSRRQEEPARLLLNPCQDHDVESYFDFHEDGTIWPKPGDPFRRLQAETSINVYGLKRSELTALRRDAIRDLKNAFIAIEKFARDRGALNASDASDDELNENLSEIWDNRDHIERSFSMTSRFLAIKRQWLREQDLLGRFEIHRRMGFDVQKLLDPND